MFTRFKARAGRQAERVGGKTARRAGEDGGTARRIKHAVHMSGADLWLFALRNAALYFLMFNAYLHLKDVLNPLFLSLAFACTALLALLMEKLRLRFWAALLAAAVFPFALRALLFPAFHLAGTLFPGPGAGLLFLLFDKDFFPFLPVYAVVWLFNFMALRCRRFVPFEILANILLLIPVFLSETGFRTGLYPHPSYFALSVIAFVLCEILVLPVAGIAAARAGRRPAGETGAAADKQAGAESDVKSVARDGERPPKTLRSLLSYLWVVIPLILVFFLLAREYREESGKHIGGLLRPTLFQLDLSRLISLQSEIELSDDLVLLLRTDGKQAKYLLRRYILGKYQPGKGFESGPRGEMDDQPSALPDYTVNLPDPGYRGRSEKIQEYYLVNFDSAALVAMNYPVRVVPYENWASSSFARVYRVSSRVFGVPPPTVRSGLLGALVSMFGNTVLEDTGPPRMDPKLFEYYTDYGDDQDILGLARSITSGGGNYGKVNAIYRYLRSNYYYSLHPGVSETGDQLHHFLFVSKKGYCSYFAFAMALLCRSLGIPARVVVGFYVGPQSQVPAFYRSEELLNFYEVRAYQAHAWVEVFFNRYGWIEFDPTSTTLAPGEEFNIILGTGDEPNLRKLLREILNNREHLKPRRQEPRREESFFARIRNALVNGLSAALGLWYILIPAAYLAVVLIWKSYPYLRYVLGRRERRRIKHLFAWCITLAGGTGNTRANTESLLEYAERLERERGILLTDLTRIYLKAVFSKEFGETDARDAKHAYREFIRSRKTGMNMFLRLAALFSPRGLWRKRI